MLETKRKLLFVLPIVVAAAIISGMYATAYATSNNTTNSTTQTKFPTELMPMGKERMGRECGGYGSVEISSAYNQTVMNIVNNDSDVKNLLAQGYTFQAMMPILKSTVQGDGTVVTSATSAVVILVNGTTGRAQVTVDVTNAKVTQIVITTRTVITK